MPKWVKKPATLWKCPKGHVTSTEPGLCPKCHERMEPGNGKVL